MSITAQQVVEAFEKTGLKPMQGGFFKVDDEGKMVCACGLTALVEYKEPDAIKNKKLGEGRSDVIQRVLDLSYTEVWDFIVGFDSVSPKNLKAKPEMFKAGYEAARLLNLPLEDF